MGSLGDKFKKLAGDQTRQLLQNFQNAQSSKTMNGYSYGKLNEDGTATLADGTVVQTVVKGRPGQYAPVFNLGNGQGLVDQPEAKFFTIDSSIVSPYLLSVVFNRVDPFGGGADAISSITLEKVSILDRNDNEFLLDSEFWPITTLSIPYLPLYTTYSVYAAAGFGGIVIVVSPIRNVQTYPALGLDVDTINPPAFPNAYYTVIHSYTLEDGRIAPVDWETGTLDINPYIPTCPSGYYSFYNDGVEGPISYDPFTNTCYTNSIDSATCQGLDGISYFTVQSPPADYRLSYSDVFLLGKSNTGKLVVDLALTGDVRYVGNGQGFYNTYDLVFTGEDHQGGGFGGPYGGHVETRFEFRPKPFPEEGFIWWVVTIHPYDGYTGEPIVFEYEGGSPLSASLYIPNTETSVCQRVSISPDSYIHNAGQSYTTVVRNFYNSPTVGFTESKVGPDFRPESANLNIPYGVYPQGSPDFFYTFFYGRNGIVTDTPSYFTKVAPNYDYSNSLYTKTEFGSAQPITCVTSNGVVLGDNRTEDAFPNTTPLYGLYRGKVSLALSGVSYSDQFPPKTTNFASSYFTGDSPPLAITDPIQLLVTRVAGGAEDANSATYSLTKVYNLRSILDLLGADRYAALSVFY